MALTKIDDRGLKTPIDLLDNEKIRFGTGNDLEIYHDGTDSFIKDTGTGALKLPTNDFVVGNAAANETQIRATENLAVQLYYDNSKKFETGSGGISVTGGINLTTNLSLLDDGIAKFGTGDDLQIYHDGSNSYLTNSTGALILQTDNLQIKNAAGNESLIRATADGDVELYYDNSKKFETFSGGISVTGNVNADGFHVGDTEKYVCGDGNDLEIKHAGDENYIWGVANQNLTIGTNATSRFVFQNDGHLRPTTDSTYDIGTDATRVRKVYADSVVQTADTGFKYVVSTQGDTNIPHNTYTTIQSDYGWVLPEAGTYLLSSSMRVRQWGVTGLIQCRLYDTTNSSVITSPDSTRMMWEDQNGDTRNVQITLTWIHTCSGAVTINQQFNTTNNSNNTSIQNDTNGRNYAYWQRIG